MPSHHLKDKFNEAKEITIKSTNNQSLIELPDEMIAPFAARKIARAFEVSEKAAEIRLLKWIRTK